MGRWGKILGMSFGTNRLFCGGIVNNQQIFNQYSHRTKYHTFLFRPDDQFCWCVCVLVRLSLAMKKKMDLSHLWHYKYFLKILKVYKPIHGSYLLTKYSLCRMKQMISGNYQFNF